MYAQKNSKHVTMDISAPNSAWPLRSSSENMPVSQQEVSRLGVKLAEVFRKNIARKKPVFTDSPEDWLPRVPDLENVWEFLYVILTDVPKRVPGLHLLAGSALYAHRLCTALGLDLDDGVVRVSLLHYNTAEEIERCIQALETVL